jgi:hypothetical protein
MGTCDMTYIHRRDINHLEILIVEHSVEHASSDIEIEIAPECQHRREHQHDPTVVLMPANDASDRCAHSRE